jgi:branched-chain amino acid transport system permease protein
MDTLQVSDRGTTEAVADSPRTAVRRAVKPAGLTILVVFLFVIPVSLLSSSVKAPYYLHIAVITLIYGAVAVGLHAPIRTGYWPVGQAAFMAVGGYTSAIVTTRFGWPIVAGLVAGGIVSGLVALGFGRITLRLNGTYFVLATFAFGEMVRLAVVNQTSVLGGASGIAGLPSINFLTGFLGFTDTATQVLSYYYVALAIMLLSILALVLVYRSSVGQTFDAMRLNRRLAQAQGLNTVRYRLFAFVLSGIIAGAAGALLVHYLHLASPTMFTYVVSVDVLMMNIIGGTGGLVGPLVGAVLIAPLPEVLRGAGAAYAQMAFGAVIIAVMLLWPGGLLGVAQKLRARGVALLKRSRS